MLDRRTAPLFAKNFNFALPIPSIQKLSNGVNLIHIDDVQQNIVKIELVFKAGKWYESKVGVSHFTAQMLEKGTIENSSQQIAEIFDLYGAQLEISAGSDFISISLYSLSKKLAKVFPLFIDVIANPSFSEEELGLMKTIFKQNLKVNNEKNGFVASKTIRRNIFGNTHPYGSSIDDADIDKIEQQDLINYFKAHFRPFEVYITGDILSDISIIKDSISSIVTNEVFETKIESSNSVPFYINVLKAESTQSSVRLGMKAINRTHPDYPSLFLLNHVFGGYFGSRLMKNIREEKGLTYGINSSLNSFLNESIFLIGADVNKDKLDLTIAEIGNEMTGLKTKEIPEAELEAARNHLLGSIQLEVANPFSITEKFKTISLNQLPPTYYQNLFLKLSQLSSKDLKVTANKYFNMEDLFVVSVG